MIRIADYRTLTEWKKIGFRPKDKNRYNCWKTKTKTPLYERMQVEKIPA